MDCITRSTELYWHDPRHLERIAREWLESMSDVQRANFVYSGDLYHLRELNPNFVMTFINEMAEKKTGSPG